MRSSSDGVRPPDIASISTHSSVIADQNAMATRYAPSIHEYLRILVGDELHDDASQELQIKILGGSLKSWERKGRFRYYLKTAVINHARDILAQHKRWNRLVALDSIEPPQTHGDPFLPLYRDNLVQLVRRAFGRADRKTRIVVELLLDRESLSAKELAVELSRELKKPIEEENARQIRRRALKASDKSSVRHEICAALFPGFDDEEKRSQRDRRSCHVGNASCLSNSWTFYSPCFRRTRAGWAQGRTAAGTQWRRAAGDLVCFVDRRSLARYSSCHGVLGTNCGTPEVATVAGKRRLGKRYL